MKKRWPFLSLILAGFFLTCCGVLTQKRNLSPEHEEFFSKVRYIITQKEKKVFLNLPPSERDEFIQNFWEKRDPNPETEENEYKKKYFQRIEKANQLFQEGGTPGWLQDRGRIYILLGRPDTRERYPTGRTLQGRPMEIWYYGPYPIIFVDRYETGNYELYPASAQYLAELMSAQMSLKPDVETPEAVFTFNVDLQKFPQDKIELLVKVPFENVFLKEKDDQLVTTLSLHLQLFNRKKDQKIWDHKKDYSVSISQEKIKEMVGKSIVIPVQKDLSPGKFRMIIFLQNQTDNKKVQKSIKFKL